jgi:hypothetical protein
MHLSRLLLAIGGAVLATAVVGGVAQAAPPGNVGGAGSSGGVSGDAQQAGAIGQVNVAVIKPPGATGGATHGGGPTGGAVQSGNFGPTNNLTAVANGVSVRAKSVTAVVTVAAELPVTNPVEVSVLFGTRRVTQDYVRSTGLRFLFQFPENGGGKRTENILVNLTERTPTGAVPFHFTVPTTIEPLYDVTFSPLTFHVLSDSCTVTCGHDPEVAWMDNAGAQYQSVSASDGDTRQLTRFARHLTEVGLASGPPKPGIVWTVWQVDLSGFHGPAAPSIDGQLLPDTTRTVHFTADGVAGDGFAHAEFSYDQAIVLRTYPEL